MLFNGAIDYYIIEKNRKFVVLFLDNHVLEEYCNYPVENISCLFDKFLKNNKITLLLEEIVGDIKYNNLYFTKHLEDFSKFYIKNNTNKNIIPIDIRLYFKKNNNIKIFFDDNIITKCKIKILINKIRLIEPMIEKHYQELKKQYILLNKQSIDDVTNVINLCYPYIIRNEDRNWDIFYSSMLELYTICNILNSKKQIVFGYFGAAHSAIIYKILVKYYNFNIKKCDTLNIIENNFIDLAKFDKLNKICIDF